MGKVPPFIPERRPVDVVQRRLAADKLNENWPPRKEQARCCLAKRLPDGRPVAGFCSPECIRRPANWRRYVRAVQRGESYGSDIHREEPS